MNFVMQAWQHENVLTCVPVYTQGFVLPVVKAALLQQSQGLCFCHICFKAVKESHITVKPGAADTAFVSN